MIVKGPQNVAWQGGDRSVMCARQGLACLQFISDRGIPEKTFSARVASAMLRWQPDAVFIDVTGGYGGEVVSRVRDAGHHVNEVCFAWKASNERFANLRAEMWFKMADWIKSGAAIPAMPELLSEICAVTYSNDNAANRLTLESKDALRARLGCSPDLADALALTFAFAKQLNSEGAASPKPFVWRDQTKVQPVRGWAPSTIRTILTREIYHGVIVWNKSRKRPVTWGQVDQRPRPQDEWLRTKAEHLRLIPEDLWRRVAARRRETEDKAVRFTSGRISGRPPKHAIQNLLAGLATCSMCGGGLVVETSPRKRGRVPEYVCYRHRHNGTCANTLHPSVAEMNEAVLQAIEEHALTPEAIEQVIHLSERDDVAEQQTKLQRERKDVEKRIARLVAAIETGGDARSLVAKVRELETRKHAIDAETASLRPVPRLAPEVVKTGWPNGAGCYAHQRRKGAPCSKGFCAAA